MALLVDEFGREIKPLAKARLRLQKKGKKKKSTAAGRKQMSAAQAALAAKRAANAIEEVNLLAPHWINGIAYGPGRVRVPAELAKVLRENERRVQENNAAFEGKKAAYIGPMNRAMHVPYQLFESPMLNVMEAMFITKDG